MTWRVLLSHLSVQRSQLLSPYCPGTQHRVCGATSCEYSAARHVTSGGQAIQIAAGGRNSIRLSLVNTGGTRTLTQHRGGSSNSSSSEPVHRYSTRKKTKKKTPDTQLRDRSRDHFLNSTSVVFHDMSTEMFAKTPMEVAVYQLHNFSISFFSSLLGGDVVSVKLDNR